jgi:cytochrome c-type biogenesis protein CcmF
LYVVFAGQLQDGGPPVVHAFLNPLVKWIWFGGVIVVLGTLVALLPERKAVLVVAAVREPASPKVAPALSPSVSLREGHD